MAQGGEQGILGGTAHVQTGNDVDNFSLSGQNWFLAGR
jgi:hypothetical protein